MASGDLKAEIEKIARRFYNGRLERGFLHWALSCVTADLEPDDDELIMQTAIDGPGDLGIDAVRVDDVNNRLVIVQAKYEDKVTRGVAQGFRASVEALKDESYVLTHGNAALKEAYPDFVEQLLDEDVRVDAYLVCRDDVAKSARAYANRTGSSPWVFDFGGGTRRKELTLTILSVGDLAEFRRQLLTDQGKPADFELHAIVKDGRLSMYEVPGEYRTLHAIVPAEDIVNAYAKYKSAIFRFNPRGPQGSNKVNRDIAGTLHDKNIKHNFHLLNNGLTIVCLSFTPNEKTGAITVQDLQIVNGCQTAYTLHSEREQVDGTVTVPVRIIEGENWAPHIAKSTNSQTAVRPEQLVSLGTEHDRLVERFERHEPPWFYEKQQGSRRFHSAAQRQLHKARFGTERVVGVKELGQACAAFMGYPILAKYDLKVLFERGEPNGRKLYAAIFEDVAEVDQLILPILVARFVSETVRSRISLAAKKSGAKATARQQLPEADWLSYARMHLVCLIGELLRAEAPKGGVTADSLLSPKESRHRLAELNDWFDNTFEKALKAARFQIAVEHRSGRLTNLREFFRSEVNLQAMIETLDD